MSRVFVSYSHESEEHQARVLTLAHRLLTVGYDVRLDRFAGHPAGESWPQWMCRQVREADAIVCVCTAAYRNRFEGDEHVGGLGVSWEGHLLTTELYLDRGRATRIFAVYTSSEEEVPFILRASTPRSIDDLDGLIAALGGRVGPARPVPPAGEGMREIVSVGRLLDPLFKPPRKFLGVPGCLPSQLLRAEHAIVPFIGGKEVVEELLDWSRGGDAAVRIVHGPGGAGKTRLALEIAGRLVREGWRAGPLARRDISDAALDELFRDPIPLFLILDYAETRHEDLVRVLRRLSDHRGANARVLLLARAIGEWWKHAMCAVRDLEGLASGRAPVRLEAVEDGSAHAAAAAAAFAAWQGVDVPTAIPNRGRTALDRHVEALVAVLGGDLWGIEGVLAHEDAYVRGASSARGIPPARAEQLGKAMALVTLAGGIGEEDAETWIRAVPRFGKLHDEDAGQIVDVLGALYPRAGGGIDGVRPDRIGEALVAREDTTGALATAAVDRGRMKEALTVLTRLGASGTRVPLERLVEARRDRVALAVVEVAQETGDPAGQVLAEVLERRPDATLACLLADVVPTDTVALREVGVVAGRQAVEAARDEGERADRLNSLSIHLGHAGRRQEALAASEDAVTICRRLVSVDGRAWSPALAAALSNLSNAASDVGLVAEALCAIEEAIRLYRTLADAYPDTFLPALGMALGNYSSQLLRDGRPAEALVAAKEAVQEFRRLVLAPGDSHLQALAWALDLLSSAHGRPQDALAAIEEAVSIRRRLADARPDAYLPSLAHTLGNLSACLHDCGDRKRALDAADEAVEIFGRLAATRPEAFRTEFARALNNRCVALARLGARVEAHAAVSEALRTLREPFLAHPAALVDQMRMTLFNYGNLCGVLKCEPDGELLEPILSALERAEAAAAEA